MIFATLVLACLQMAALGQTPNGNLANVSGGGSSIRWDVVVPNSGGNLTISAPDGRVFYREFKAGGSPEITLNDRQLEKLPDGSYAYELRLRPVLSAGEREALKAARGKDDDPEAERAGRKRPVTPVLAQSGSFAILNGAIVIGGAVEGQRTGKITEPRRTAGVVSGNTVTRLRNHRLSLFAMPFDIIHPDDVIIQGSLCVGFDCVNGENFGFDTVRLKENSTRLQFDDTSVSAGFPTNNWQIRANDSASGGGSFLGIVDQGTTGNSETGTIIGRFDAGAPANSLRVSNIGKVGIKTGSPVLDLHITNSDTPAQRLEQTNAGGFTAQTWDVAGNEANFFIRDVTGGSRLSFRIRPGAPTSSIDISADGDVGIGTASPDGKLHVKQISDGYLGGIRIERSDAARVWALGTSTSGDRIGFSDGATDLFTLLQTGRVGIGTTAPTQLLSVNGTAGKPGGGTWDVFSDERLKNIKGNFTPGLSAVMRLQPLRYQYKPGNALSFDSNKEYVGFGAQELQKVLPEAVSTNANGYLQVSSDPILWTMLNAIKEQQKEIAELKAQVERLQNSRRRRK